MNFLSRFLGSSWYDWLAQGVHTALQHLVYEPVRGLGEVIIGVGLSAPDLTQGAVHAVASQLTLQGRAKVAAGATLISSGLRRLAWPLVLLGGLGIYGLLGVVRTAAVVLFFLVTSMSLADYWQWQRQAWTRSAA